MTRDAAYQMMRELNKIFDIVRLVDVPHSIQYAVNEQGEIIDRPEKCFAVWNKGNRCENCISAKAFAQKTQLTKFEFVGNEIYFVISRYLELEEKEYMLEMVSLIHDNVFFSAYGKSEFTQKIEDYNRRLYTDTLTGVYNRTYFDEQVSGFVRISAIAMMDVDRFKSVNDTYGHQVGDKALRKVADCIRSCVRSADIVVRYGGDEFVLVFTGISFVTFQDRLEKIRSVVEQAVIEDHPEIRLSISIGGYYTSVMSPAAIEKADTLLYEAKKVRNAVMTEQDV